MMYLDGILGFFVAFGRGIIGQMGGSGLTPDGRLSNGGSGLTPDG